MTSKPHLEQVQCGNCNLRFPDTEGGKRRECPGCGSIARRITLELRDTFQVADSTEGKSIRVFYKRHPVALTVVVAISIGSPLLGFWLVGLPGVLAGVSMGVLSLVLGPIAVTKVKEVQRF